MGAQSVPSATSSGEFPSFVPGTKTSLKLDGGNGIISGPGADGADPGTPSGGRPGSRRDRKKKKKKKSRRGDGGAAAGEGDDNAPVIQTFEKVKSLCSSALSQPHYATFTSLTVSGVARVDGRIVGTELQPLLTVTVLYNDVHVVGVCGWLTPVLYCNAPDWPCTGTCDQLICDAASGGGPRHNCALHAD